MRHLSVRTKQVIVLFLLAIVGGVAAIIHGIFFDLDFDQIQRLTLEGAVLTVIIFFPTLLFMEWVFEWNNNEKMKRLEDQIKALRNEVRALKKK